MEQKSHNPVHAFKEKERISKISQIREVVFGAQDGLLVPLGVISSVAGAFSNNHIVIIAGISEALAGSFSMATGAYLASQAEQQVHKSAIKKEEEEIEKFPEDEKVEMRLLFEREDMPKDSAQSVSDLLWNHKKSFVYTMVQKELGLEPEPSGSIIHDALMVGISYLVAAIIPLSPYFFLKGLPAIITSILATFVALFSIGLIKGKVATLPLIKSGLEVLLIGAGAGIGGYFLGTILPHILGA
ncbi:MAG TPA: VIT1/CCC1 transporter family protein [Candidatus Saccharimonadales bacterium]|jgi:VIT1/CCC1 family predicted Fe2+/Mn2+ transporter|nr:VIT1/CCC1 transporter family protein [Candidatus Saccharimonadales bacterium]